MQTAKIIPIEPRLPNLNADNSLLGITESEWLMPGKVTTVAPGIHCTVAYDQTDGEYTTRFKFWYQGVRIKDYHLDKNHQIDLQHSCQRIITMLCTKYDPNTGRPFRTLISIEYKAWPWKS